MSDSHPVVLASVVLASVSQKAASELASDSHPVVLALVSQKAA